MKTWNSLRFITLGKLSTIAIMYYLPEMSGFLLLEAVSILLGFQFFHRRLNAWLFPIVFVSSNTASKMSLDSFCGSFSSEFWTNGNIDLSFFQLPIYTQISLLYFLASVVYCFVYIKRSVFQSFFSRICLWRLLLVIGVISLNLLGTLSTYAISFIQPVYNSWKILWSTFLWRDRSFVDWDFYARCYLGEIRPIFLPGPYDTPVSLVLLFLYMRLRVTVSISTGQLPLKSPFSFSEVSPSGACSTAYFVQGPDYTLRRTPQGDES